MNRPRSGPDELPGNTPQLGVHRTFYGFKSVELNHGVRRIREDAQRLPQRHHFRRFNQRLELPAGREVVVQTG